MEKWYLIAIEELTDNYRHTKDKNSMEDLAFRLLNLDNAEIKTMNSLFIKSEISKNKIHIDNLDCIEGRLVWKNTMIGRYPRYEKKVNGYGGPRRLTVLGLIYNKYVLSNYNGRLRVMTGKEVAEAKLVLTNGKVDYLTNGIEVKPLKYGIEFDRLDSNPMIKSMNNKLKILNAPYIMVGDTAACITNFEVEDMIIHEGVQNINLTCKKGDTFNRYNKIHLPSTLISIPEEFASDSTILNIEICNGVKKINKKAFIESEIYNTLVIPKSVRKIEEMAFGYSDINEVIIESEDLEIETSAFIRARIGKLKIKSKNIKIKEAFHKAVIHEAVVPEGLDLNIKNMYIKNLTIT